MIMEKFFAQGKINMNISNSDCKEIHYNKYKNKWKTIPAII